MLPLIEPGEKTNPLGLSLSKPGLQRGEQIFRVARLPVVPDSF
jgi:hypothetical protein